MGSSARPKPARLAEKLLLIRTALGLSQNEMLRKLGLEEKLFRSSISKYELGTREPPLPVLLKYARAANIYVDLLIDDELDLPLRLPAKLKGEGKKKVND
ncbi:MAG TPA: helix-turn-helix transcriptional regulator [Pyrinomonadaceae bacterium]|nr:helix-turn-helix transcriptional regulator [Pyrinomonadaceae bacterium]